MLLNGIHNVRLTSATSGLAGSCTRTRLRRGSLESHNAPNLQDDEDRDNDDEIPLLPLQTSIPCYTHWRHQPPAALHHRLPPSFA